MGSDWLRKCRSNTSYADNAHAPASGGGPASRPPLSSRMAHPVVSDVLRCIAVLAGALFGTSAAVGQAPSSRDTAEAAIWRLVIAQDSAERPIVSRTFATPRFICGPFRSPSCEVDSLPVAFQSPCGTSMVEGETRPPPRTRSSRSPGSTARTQFPVATDVAVGLWCRSVFSLARSEGEIYLTVGDATLQTVLARVVTAG